jgi:O-acetyl-ADP-ribose deacetylase (regulator of RNase III)
MKIKLVKGSILECTVEAIVNLANPQLLRGGGLSGIIHKAAGEELFQWLKEWKRKNKRPKINFGEAILSPSFNLPHKHIIHAVGAVWKDGNNNEEDTLKECYINCLCLAIENNIRSIAFPNISTGIYGFPKDKAAEIAISAVSSCNQKEAIDKIEFICYDNENFDFYRQLLLR